MPARPPEPPELDVARIQDFARHRLPKSVAADLRLEVEVEGPNVTIVERRLPSWPDIGPEWSRQPIAQVRFDRARSTWTLYWPRASGRWQRYDLDPAPTIDRLLAKLDADPDGVFWG